jgi:hypothetical protein
MLPKAVARALNKRYEGVLVNLLVIAVAEACRVIFSRLRPEIFTMVHSLERTDYCGSGRNRGAAKV